jgi:hypothetical protein
LEVGFRTQGADRKFHRFVHDLPRLLRLYTQTREED